PTVLDRSRVPMWPLQITQRVKVKLKDIALAEVRPAGAPDPATSQPVDEVSDEMIAADVLAYVTVPAEGKPLQIELEISALNTTRTNLPLSRPYGLSLRSAAALRANDAYGPLVVDYVDGEV